ncbi:MAG TPA: sterol desaturase family protein, partial [bacterium]|nr:sterol desaturase family protein [bacterium]
HTGEMVLSMAIKYALVLALGAPALGVFLFELILNLTSMFSHANIRLPLQLDALLRVFIVTPDMHRIHHSAIPNETNSNFGFNFSMWDHLGKTYRSDPRGGQERIKIGLEIFRDLKFLGLGRLLAQPFLDIRGRFAWGQLFRKN